MFHQVPNHVRIPLLNMTHHCYPVQTKTDVKNLKQQRDEKKCKQDLLIQNAKNKSVKNQIDETILHDEFKSSLLWEYFSEVLKGLKIFSRKTVKLSCLKETITECVERLGRK